MCEEKVRREREREEQRECAKEKQQSWQMKLLRQGKSWRRNIIRNSWAVFGVGQRGFALSWGWGRDRARGSWSSDYANCMATGNCEWQEAQPRGKVRGRRGANWQVAQLGWWQVAVADAHKTKLPIQF